jgi:hypothetical protein
MWIEEDNTRTKKKLNLDLDLNGGGSIVVKALY